MSSGDVDISLTKGDRLVLIQDYANGWIKVQQLSSNNSPANVIGLVPSNYIEEAAAQETIISK